MNWKDFFRPTKGKIILAIVIFLIMPIYLETNIQCPVCHPEIEDCPPCPYLSFNVLVFNIDSILEGFPANFLFFGINLVLSYAVSCLIIFLYKEHFFKNKSLKKKGKRK